jgi:hypothetical protein
MKGSHVIERDTELSPEKQDATSVLSLRRTAGGAVRDGRNQ